MAPQKWNKESRLEKEESPTKLTSACCRTGFPLHFKPGANAAANGVPLLAGSFQTFIAMAIAAQGSDQHWAMRREFLSLQYSTRWSDIPTIKT
ncbi:DUF4113 domain-containing protein [Shewanella baltica]|uniref:DUF4113 domain-containing protein n=1 Tax=Shewanella baltica TaxID=62322 RepID=UPI003D7A19BA